MEAGTDRFYDFLSQEESGTVALIKNNRQATRTCRLFFYLKPIIW